MGQTQSGTAQGYGELGKLAAGEAATAFKSVCCLKTTCTADATQTAAGITKCTESGLTLVNADSVKSSKTTADNDTVEVDHVFTAGEAATVKGFGVFNDDDDVLYGICCFAADVALQASDTLTVEMKSQFKVGSA
jgi:hypothetical protein